MRIYTRNFCYQFLAFIGISFLLISCNGGGSPAPNNPCTGITVTVTATSINPTGSNSNGSITASASGGSGFTYSLNGGTFQSSGSFTGLAAGTYTIAAKNGDGCSGSGSFTLTAVNLCAGVTITVAGATVNPTTPTGTNGSITVNASGGATPYTYKLNSGTPQSSNVFNNLAVGSYTVTVTDANNCSGTGNFNLLNPCAGVTISVSGTSVSPTTGGGTNGSITASASGGVGPYSYSSNGTTFQTSNVFNNLGSGSYTITAKDANGCTGTGNFTLTNPCTGVNITVGATLVNPSTSGGTNGSVTASATGGTAPYTYNVNAGAFQGNGTFNNLGAGTYVIIAKDAIGCTGTNTFVLTNPDPCAGITISQVINTSPNVLCASPNGSLTSLASGGLLPYTYSLNGGPFQGSGTFNNLSAASYTITAQDANNCQGITNGTVVNAAAGPKFSDVKALILANCAISGCHAGVQSPDFRVDCNIVANGSLIQQRAVNGNPSAMPPTGLLSSTERQKITDWINAGGRYND
jgi:SprB repeat